MKLRKSQLQKIIEEALDEVEGEFKPRVRKDYGGQPDVTDIDVLVDNVISEIEHNTVKKFVSIVAEAARDELKQGAVYWSHVLVTRIEQDNFEILSRIPSEKTPEEIRDFNTKTLNTYISKKAADILAPIRHHPELANIRKEVVRNPDTGKEEVVVRDNGPAKLGADLRFEIENFLTKKIVQFAGDIRTPQTLNLFHDIGGPEDED